jgi:putative membrane protein
LRFLVRLVLNALALLLVAHVVGGIYVAGFLPALVAVAVLGVVNTLIRPLLIILTLPLTLLTLGLFALVINAFMFKLTSVVVPGFTVTGAWPAFGGALLYSALTTLINWLLAEHAGPAPRF